MKTIIFFILLAPAAGICQGFLPRWEMSLSADANSWNDRQANTQYMSLAFRPAFFPILGEGLAIEPEVFFGRSWALNSLSLSGNVSYSLGIGYWPIVPFVLVGYGMGNGIPYDSYMPHNPQPPNTPGYSDATFLNIGGGAKIMVLGGRALFKVEYRYQAFDATYSTYTDHIYGRRLLLGFSVLL